MGVNGRSVRTRGVRTGCVRTGCVRTGCRKDGMRKDGSLEIADERPYALYSRHHDPPAIPLLLAERLLLPRPAS